MRSPDILNDTDLVVIDMLQEATAEMRHAREQYGLHSPEFRAHRAAVGVLRAVLSAVGFDSEGIDNQIGDE